MLMYSKEELLDKAIHVREDLRKKSPLIHVLTHPITMNDTANLLLAAHVHPIMAQHSLEIREVVGRVDALAINLGNVTPSRLEAMQRAGQVVIKRNLATIIDVVGAGISLLRFAFAKNWIEDYHPLVVKGNISEICALTDIKHCAHGVEASKEDINFFEENEKDLLQHFAEYARKWQAIFLITGKKDFIVSAEEVCAISNGSYRMSFLTGTGCMLGALVASYLAVANPFLATLTATVEFAVVGELAEEKATNKDGFLGMGTYHQKLFDVFSTLPLDFTQVKDIFARVNLEYKSFT